MTADGIDIFLSRRQFRISVLIAEKLARGRRWGWTPENSALRILNPDPRLTICHAMTASARLYRVYTYSLSKPF